MSHYVATQSGNWSTASTWNKVLNTSPGMATSTVVNVGLSPLPTAAGTASSSTGNIVGGVVFPVAGWAGKTVTFQLQANSVDVPGATVVITGSNVNLLSPLFVKLTSPVAKTSGVAYRFTIKSTATSTQVAAAVQGSGAASAVMIIEDTTGVPGANDFVCIATPNTSSDVTVTIDDTTTVIGDGTASSTFFSALTTRSWNQVMVAGSMTNVASLKFSPTVDTKLSWRSNILFLSNGKLEQKPDSTHSSEFYMDTGVATSCWLGFFDGSIIDVLDSQMPSANNWRTKVTSGAGTTASPLVLTTSADWDVGNRVIVTSGTNSATNYLECEEKYIKTKINATTYTLADTAGGAESGLTYTHDGAHVFNIHRSIKWTSASADSWHCSFNSNDATNTAHSLKGLEISGLTTSGSSARAAFCLNGYGTFEDICNYDNNTSGSIINWVTGQAMMTVSRLFIGNGGISGNSQSGRIAIASAVSNKTLVDCWVVACDKVGFKIEGGNHTFIRSGSIATPRSAALINLYSGWNVSGNLNTFNDCEAYASNGFGILLYASAADATFTRFISGTIAKNQYGSVFKGGGTPAYMTAYFDEMQQASPTLFLGNESLFEGSEIIFKNLNNVEYTNYRFTNNGQAQFTGPGLADTTVPNLGTYAVRIDPITSTGLKFRYRQLASPGTNFVTYGRIWGNSTFVSDPNTSITVELYLPGTIPGVDAPSQSVTMTKTTDKTSADATFNLSEVYNGAIAENAVIIVTIKNPSATAGASVYVGDLLNSENATTKFEDVWEGETQQVMPLGASTDPGSVAVGVWSYGTRELTANTSEIGEILSNTDATQAKVDLL